jgi:hypothetical protein
MNVLRFPIQLRTGKNQFLRVERLKEREENEMTSDQTSNPMENSTTATGETPVRRMRTPAVLSGIHLESIQPTVKWRRRRESEVNLPKSGLSYTYSSGDDAFAEDHSFESREHSYVNYRQKKMRAFNPDSYQKEKWLYDTPGVILSEQV